MASNAARGLHYIPGNSQLVTPALNERGVWEYFSGKAAEKGLATSDLLTEVVKCDIEIGEALK